MHYSEKTFEIESKFNTKVMGLIIINTLTGVGGKVEECMLNIFPPYSDSTFKCDWLLMAGGVNGSPGAF